jgi:diadenylate cyclase
MIDALFNNGEALHFGWRDGLDILLMAVLIYQVGLLLRGTRAFQTLVGVLIVILAYWATGPDKPLRLVTFHQALGNVLFYAPFAVIVLFQTAIRRALARLGRTSVLGFGAIGLTDAMLEEILAAVEALAARKSGALIVIERDQALKDQVESGTPLDAAISRELILNLFTPGSPLHDGAAIVGDGRIRAASCFLPVTNDPLLSREYGSRHRAAIGLTEEYDSVAIVVSEERSEVRAAVDGSLGEPLDIAGLRSFLRRHLEMDSARRGFLRPGNGSARRPDAA